MLSKVTKIYDFIFYLVNRFVFIYQSIDLYILPGSKWNIDPITYRLTKYPTSGMTNAETDTEIARAKTVRNVIEKIIIIRTKIIRGWSYSPSVGLPNGPLDATFTLIGCYRGTCDEK